MNRESNYSVNLNFKSTISFLAIVFMLLFIGISMCSAQDSAATTTTAAASVDTVASSGKVNDSMKMVFSEMKKGGEDNVFITIGMIVGVLAVVGIAMYISFREPAKPKKA